MKISKHIKSSNLLKSDYRYCYIISEIGINHNGDIDTALKLIQASYDAGVDAVKFQKRNLKDLYTEKVINNPNSAEWNIDYLIPILKEVELTEKDYFKIKSKCNELGIELIITPFDVKSANFCHSLGIDAFKIGSADMVNFDLIAKCASFKKPTIISTGMWTEKEIKESVDYYKKNFKDLEFFMLLANSTYPTPYESINLQFLPKLKKIHHNVGYSGHERGVFVPAAAYALGARIIEKHITFDRNQTGPDHKASMLPCEFKTMVQNIRNLQLAMGKNKTVNQAEKLAKESFAKSAYANKDIMKGDILKKDDIIFKSPGKGLHSHELHGFLGKPLNCNIKKNNCISRLHFEPIVPISKWSLPKFSKNWGVKCRFHDYEEYKCLNLPTVEFHCSETDIDTDFKSYSKNTQLVMHAPEIFGRNLIDICTDNQEVVNASIELLQKSIDKTLHMSKYFNKNKPKFVVHLGGMSLDHVTEEKSNELFLERAIDNFKKLQFNNSDIEILPENLPPRPWYLGGQWFQYGFMHSDDMLKFCNHFGLNMTFDVCHAKLHCNHQNICLNEYTKKVMPIVSHLHISDAKGIDGEGIQIGEGEIDFDSFFNIVKNSKNNEYTWVTEVWSGHVNNGSGHRKSMHNLSRFKYIL